MKELIRMQNTLTKYSNLKMLFLSLDGKYQSNLMFQKENKFITRFFYEILTINRKEKNHLKIHLQSNKMLFQLN